MGARNNLDYYSEKPPDKANKYEKGVTRLGIGGMQMSLGHDGLAIAFHLL